MFAQLGYYICVPFAWLTRLFYTWTGSYGVALILFTLMVKLVILPFQLKSKKSMLRMGRMNGKVEEIYEDDSLGITVRVSHSDGLESLYSNLRTGCPVKAGQRLNAGDLIGYVGETAVA